MNFTAPLGCKIHNGDRLGLGVAVCEKVGVRRSCETDVVVSKSSSASPYSEATFRPLVGLFHLFGFSLCGGFRGAISTYFGVLTVLVDLTIKCNSAK